MYVERLQVDAEGFLAGLDIEFAPGLNVLIGARGTGKTSIIELLRFALDAGSLSVDAEARGRQQALAILDGGAVTVTLRDGVSQVVVTRSATGVSVTPFPVTEPITVLGQNEIEAVGTQASGRLALIDRFRTDRDSTSERAEVLRGRLRSLTEEISGLIAEGRAVSRDIESLTGIGIELEQAKDVQRRLLESSAATSEQQQTLAQLQNASQIVAAREQILVADKDNAASFAGELQQLADRVPRLLQPWPDDAGNDPLLEVRGQLSELARSLGEALSGAQGVAESIQSAQNETVAIRQTVDDRSRELRQQLETLQSGVGLAARRVAELEERQGQFHALNTRLVDRRARFVSVAEERDAVYAELDAIRSSITDARREVVEGLNETLLPAVRVSLVGSDMVDEYVSALVNALRGSRVHYNQIAPIIAREVSPLELVSWAENSNAEALASAVGIAVDRASGILLALQESGTASLIAAHIDDGVILELLDGPDYKSSDRLSIGQRCTAVLPVLLGHHGDPLVLDQPEDHLDNAFIASTLVEALRRRTDQDQFIFASHNANIPVLGEADRVIAMDSDGERGFVSSQESLDETASVSAVTRILEGGLAAFEARASFYSTRAEIGRD